MSKQSRISNPQRRMAAAILKCGTNRIWVDPAKDLSTKQAITRADVRRLIGKGVIRKEPVKHVVAGPKFRKQRIGSRKGKMGARIGKKTLWLKMVRPQRDQLRKLKAENKLVEGGYRKIYRMIKGGMFRSRSHLMFYLKDKKLLREGQ